MGTGRSNEQLACIAGVDTTLAAEVPVVLRTEIRPAAMRFREESDIGRNFCVSSLAEEIREWLMSRVSSLRASTLLKQ
jgi:hypothetical protein